MAAAGLLASRRLAALGPSAPAQPCSWALSPPAGAAPARPSPTRLAPAQVAQLDTQTTASPGAEAPVAPKQQLQASERYRPFLDEWDKGFFDVEEDPAGGWLRVTAGAIPPQLEGTFFRVGPGKFSIGGSQIGHPYDGDGFVCSIAFKGGKAYFRSRFVETEEYKTEQRLGTIAFRGTFATQRAGGAWANWGDLHVKNTSNTNVISWGNRLLTLFEAGQPYEMDPELQGTRGLADLQGAAPPGMPFDLGSSLVNQVFGRLMTRGLADKLPPALRRAGGRAFTAHPHVDPRTGNLVAFSYAMQPKASWRNPMQLDTDVRFHEFDSRLQLVSTVEYAVPGFAFLHDFLITEHYYVIMQNPVTVNSLPYMLGRAPSASCVRFQPAQPLRVHLVPRAQGGAGAAAAPRVFDLPSAAFVFHHVNAYEEADGQHVVIDSIHYRSLPAVGKEALPEQQVDPDVPFTSRLKRVVLDLASGGVEVRALWEGEGAYLELPALNNAVFGRRHRYVYGYTSWFDPPQIGITKVDTVSGRVRQWWGGFQHIAMEPRFVAKPGAVEEDDGWLLFMVYHSGNHASRVEIVDAKTLAAVATIALDSPVPHQIHGSWTPQYFGPPI